MKKIAKYQVADSSEESGQNVANGRETRNRRLGKGGLACVAGSGWEMGLTFRAPTGRHARLPGNPPEPGIVQMTVLGGNS